MENANKKNVKKEEIDDFAKALLDKKTDIAIYAKGKESETIQENETEQERKEAEKTLSSALDMLRKERGQSTIAEEEQKFYFSSLNPEDEDNMDDEDFTTSSFEEMKTQSFDVNTVAKALHEYDNDQTIRTKLKVDLNKSNAKGVEHPKESKPEESKKARKKKKKTKEPKKKRSKKRLIIILSAAVLVAACMCGYAYKIYVWDPAHVVTEEMQTAYDKLVAYADEYGSDLDNEETLMSDSERFELLNMEDDYDILNSTQKEQINDYFKEQTKMTYTELVKELKDMQKQMNDPANASYQTISQLLNRWSSLTADQQYQIIDLEDDYQALPSSLQNRIDELATANADSKFTELVKRVTQARDASQEQQSSQRQQQASDLQSQLSSLQSQLASYQQYASTLNSELQTAQNNGDTASISELNAAIESNNASIERLQEQINSIQEQISALG